MNRGRLHLMIGAVALALTSCGRGSPQPLAPAGLFSIDERVFRGNETGIRENMERPIRTAEELQPLWEQATSTQRSKVPLPEVDFRRQMLVLVAGGRRWDEDVIRVDSVAERRSGDGQRVLMVYYSITQGCRRVAQNAYPVEIVRVRNYSGEVFFDKSDRPATGCR